MYKLITIAVLMAAGAAVTVAKPAERTLRVAAISDDSATLIAAWSASNADTVRVVWTGLVSRNAIATGARRADTVRVARPTVDALVSVSLTPKRGTRIGAVRSATVTVTARVLPPTIDSIRVDTSLIFANIDSAMMDAAMLDSFPVTEIRRADQYDVGWPPSVIPLNESRQLCLLGRNRYTGLVTILVGTDLSDAEAEAVGVACESARTQYQSERSG